MQLSQTLSKITPLIFGYQNNCYNSLHELPQFNWERLQKTSDLTFLVKKRSVSKTYLTTLYKKLINEYLREIKPETYFELIDLKTRYANYLANTLIDPKDMRSKSEAFYLKNEIAELEKKSSKELSDPFPQVVENYGFIDKTKISVIDYNNLISELIRKSNK
jgi:hypothetical protein